MLIFIIFWTLGAALALAVQNIVLRDKNAHLRLPTSDTDQGLDLVDGESGTLLDTIRKVPAA